MPAKNVVKQYANDTLYHLYNRGVEKRKIFLDEQDYAVMLLYLKQYLLQKDEDTLQKSLADPTINYKEKDTILKLLRLNNFSDEITLYTYCLMSNHFHFLVKQRDALSIDRFMQSLCTRYTQYFNKKYKRIGTLFQGVYKAVMVTSDEQLLHLTRYIHRQSLNLASQGETLQGLQGQPSSYPEYCGKRNTAWVHPETVLPFFSKTHRSLSYEAFVQEEADETIISTVILD